MTIAPHRIGIDIAKDWLDVFDATTNRASRVRNERAAITAFVTTLPAHATLTFEATGSFDRLVHHIADAAGLTIYRVNPRQIRDLARARGIHAKTDAIDARHLATAPDRLDLDPAGPVDVAREALASLQRRRDQLVEQRAVERGRSKVECDPIVRKDLAHSIIVLTTKIRVFDQAIAAQLETPAFAPTVRLLRTVKGVGPVTITTLVALLPELGQRTSKEIAALVGLAPFNHDSGKMKGVRQIAGGRRRVRRALYMAALSVIRRHAHFKAFYDGIFARRDKAKIAIIAVARKLLVTLNAMVKTGTPFETRTV
jgi:transposase